MYQLLLILQYITILVLIVEAGYICARWRTSLQGILFFNCVSTLVSSCGYLLEMQSQTEREYIMAVQMSYLGRAWIGFSLFVFVMKLCNIRLRKRYLIILSWFHGTTFLLVLTMKWQSLYYRGREYVMDGLFPYVRFEHGIWHDLFELLLLFYTVFGLYVLTRATIRETKRSTKNQLILVLLAMGVESGFFVAHSLGVGGNYDVTTIGHFLCAIVMFVAIFRFNLLDTLQAAQDYVMDEISEGVIVVDKDDYVEYFNATAKSIFPVLREDGAGTLEMFRRATDKGEPVVIQDRIYEIKAKSLYHNETQQGTVFVLADDTEHYTHLKELEEQKQIAEDANASKSAFLSVVSHEIRTPMNAVVGMTDLLLREEKELTEKQVTYLKNIKNSGAALVMIVNDLLDQSKIEAGKMEIIEEPYELRPMLEDVRLIIENRIGSKPVELIYEVDGEVPRFLNGDSLRIRQILINLMNNAVKFTESGHIILSIRVESVRRNKVNLRFGVRDSGQGIRKEDLAKLGQAFAQVDTKRNHGKEGTGLGLSISGDFISMMGGKLEIASEYGVGTEFYFTIKQGIEEGIAANEECGMATQAWREDEEFTAPDARILIVDDTEINLMITAELLEPLGMTIDLAKDGETAVEMIKQNRYHAVFMDYMMPQLNGVEATEKVRSLEEDCEDPKTSDYYRTVPIIALSGDSSDETKEIFRNAGINDFAEKPVDLKNLKRLLLKWMPNDVIVASEEDS